MSRTRPRSWAVAAALMLAATLAGCGSPGSSESSAETRCSYPTDGPSAARVWNEVALDAIRRDFPAPTVHARNLYHLSAAMWDAWTRWDSDGSSLFAEADDRRLDLSPEQRERQRADAITYAARDVLSRRYDRAVGAEATQAQIDETFARYCDDETGDVAVGSAAAWGQEVAARLLEANRNDGSFETSNYDDFSYASVNPPLVVSESGATMVNPDRWQPLSLSSFVTQNGIEQPAGAQAFIGPSWGRVVPFALEHQPDTGLPIDPGPPPTLATDPEGWSDGIVDVIALSAKLDPATSADADYLRVIAEFWADGPDSETPPGHWNVLTNEVGDALEREDGLRIMGTGDAVNRLEWDVKVYLALNGANHDAAIAAWGTKAHYDYARPISMIRYAAGQGQSSDENRSDYDPAGLPLIPGLIEVVSPQSSAPGERHEHLADSIDDVTIRSWQGSPDDPTATTVGVGWIRAVDWMPYQRPDFVSPAFASYVSGHSAFSRASAVVLAAFTGSDEFPGGPFVHVVEPGDLRHERGPEETVTLQWATFVEAADEAGFSRRAGGIHVPADDLVGRELGAAVASVAWERVLLIYSSAG